MEIPLTNITVMEEEHGSVFTEDTGQSVTSSDSDLRDESYLRLVEDFLGPQCGERLQLDGTPCKNKLLIQVGMLKEDRKVSWGSVMKWLRKIFPIYHSLDFHALIERTVETSMSLNGEARQSFLESNADFEFVGPICETAGIRRSDLLKMSDFSEQDEGIDITNGLVMELYSFILREKMDLVVLLAWLRNFNHKFCSKDNVDKTYKALKRKLLQIRPEYQLYQRNRHRSNWLRDFFLQTEFVLHSGPSSLQTKPYSAKQKRNQFFSKSTKNVKKPAAHSVFRKETSTIDQKSVLGRDENEAPLSMTTEDELGMNSVRSEADSVLYPDQTRNLVSVKEEHDPSSIEHCQTETHVENDTAINLNESKGEVLTLLDLFMLILQKLSSVHGVKTNEAEQVSKDLLQKHFTLMLQEDNIIREFNEKINKYQVDLCSVTPPLHFLDCNARFLLAVGEAVEQQIITFEREVCLTTGESLGRDKNPKFVNFVNFSESASTRYIRMVCDFLSPLSETKYSCGGQWLDYCQMRNKRPKLAACRSNRFISYFECATGVAHHYTDIVAFLSDLKSSSAYRTNIILESLEDDANDMFIQALVCVLAIVYCKILGPYWQLLKSSEEYVNFHRHVYNLHQKLVQWSEDASSLLLPESSGNIFSQFPLQESNFAEVFLHCTPTPERDLSSLIRKCLQKTVKTITDITESNLKDFLQGGTDNKHLSIEQCLELKSCQLSHLMGDYPYGHAYPYGLTSAPAVNFAESQDTEEWNKTPLELSSKSPILAAVTRHGGPCRSKQDVDRLLMRMNQASLAQKREAVRCEINYQKMMLGKDKDLTQVGFSLADMVTKLKNVLPEIGRYGATRDDQKDASGQVTEKVNRQNARAVSSQSISISAPPYKQTRLHDSINLREITVENYRDYRESFSFDDTPSFAC
ncbi:solute carrier family 52, riboflavin transporter, member 2 isoform X2 [Paramormyrops kingsleyae]|nr:solute carrier family 52, riboflavin transporter, member 2 isoform X2 [Paramormyrops kingsleyae]